MHSFAPGQEQGKTLSPSFGCAPVGNPRDAVSCEGFLAGLGSCPGCPRGCPRCPCRLWCRCSNLTGLHNLEFLLCTVCNPRLGTLKVEHDGDCKTCFRHFCVRHSQEGEASPLRAVSCAMAFPLGGPRLPRHWGMDSMLLDVCVAVLSVAHLESPRYLNGTSMSSMPPPGLAIEVTVPRAPS